MSSKIIIDRYPSPCGELVLGDCQGQLCLCDWALASHRTAIDRRISRWTGLQLEEGRTELTIETAGQLDEYFSKQCEMFSLPLLLCGTEFQREVWRYLLTIPYGETISYLDLAGEVRRPEAVRAVANAVGANALAVIVPCHRIVAASGALGGYSGGAEAKRNLLLLEKHG